MKLRMFVFTVLMTALSLSAFAQRSAKSPTERAEKATQKMNEVLNLSDDQLERVEAINLKYAEQAAPVRAKAKKSREEVKAQMKTIRQAQKDELAEVLTPEQLETWQAHVQAQKKQRKAKHRHRSGHPPRG